MQSGIKGTQVLGATVPYFPGPTGHVRRVHICNSMICLCRLNRLRIGEDQELKNYNSKLAKVSCLSTIIRN